MGISYGFLLLVYLNAVLSSGVDSVMSEGMVQPRFDPLYYISRYPATWLDIARRNAPFSHESVRKIAIGVGKRLETAGRPETNSPAKRSPEESKRSRGARVDQKTAEEAAEFLRARIPSGLRSLLRPILTSEELATQLRDDPRLAKAIVDTWIDTNNDGVITGSEILGRK